MIKEITDYSGYYVSDDGRVFSERSGTRIELKLARDKNGYLIVGVRRDDGAIRTLRVHRIVAMMFIPNPDNLPLINHKNEIKDDNRVENLEWCTASYNVNYGSCPEKISKSRIGEKNPAKRPDVRRNISRSLNGREITICCQELGKMFYSYAECNDYIRKEFNDKWFQVEKKLKQSNGYYPKLNLHFYEIIDDPNQLSLEL